MIQYNDAVIDPGLADLRTTGGKLTTEQDNLNTVATKFLAMNEGQTRANFETAMNNFGIEFGDTITILQKIVATSDELKRDAHYVDASAANSFPV